MRLSGCELLTILQTRRSMGNPVADNDADDRATTAHLKNAKTITAAECGGDFQDKHSPTGGTNKKAEHAGELHSHPTVPKTRKIACKAMSTEGMKQ